MELDKQYDIIQTTLQNHRTDAGKNGYRSHDVERVTKLIQEHLFDPDLNVGSTLNRCRVTDHNFPSKFKYVHRQTIHGFIESRRIEASIQLLKFDELDVSAIAFSVGYSAYRTFLRAFKRRMKCTPTEYRDRISATEVGLNSTG